MREAVVFLQNAWKRHPFSPHSINTRDEEDWGPGIPDWYKDAVDWPRRSWLWATSRCRTGQRLILMYPELFAGSDSGPIWLDDTTGKCAIGDSSMKLPPDPGFIRSVLGYLTPEYVVTCGAQATKAVGSLWKGKLIALPHPACRIVTNALYIYAGSMARSGQFERVRLVQGRGTIIEEVL